MTTLVLMGLAPGIVAAVVFWCGRAIDRGRRDDQALLESSAATAVAERMREVFGRRGLTPAERRVLPWPPPPLWTGIDVVVPLREPPDVRGGSLSDKELWKYYRSVTAMEPEPHIEVLKLRAAKLYNRLPRGPDAVVMQAIRSGDREALMAVLREEGG